MTQRSPVLMLPLGGVAPTIVSFFADLVDVQAAAGWFALYRIGGGGSAYCATVDWLS
jgi:hypothetical protein